MNVYRPVIAGGGAGAGTGAVADLHGSTNHRKKATNGSPIVRVALVAKYLPQLEVETAIQGQWATCAVTDFRCVNS